MAEKKIYYAAKDGFIDGMHYAQHSPVKMTAGAARYHVLCGSLLESLPKKEKTDAGGAKPDKGGN